MDDIATRRGRFLAGRTPGEAAADLRLGLRDAGGPWWPLDDRGREFWDLAAFIVAELDAARARAAGARRG
jgi:hypothetical protein